MIGETVKVFFGAIGVLLASVLWVYTLSLLISYIEIRRDREKEYWRFRTLVKIHEARKNRVGRLVCEVILNRAINTIEKVNKKQTIPEHIINRRVVLCSNEDSETYHPILYGVLRNSGNLLIIDPV
jgi:transcriptional/translational regulatory protein YebC/TACO1